MVRKLISGGQTGADQCILAVGRRLGIPIGGLVPRGWLTEAGPQPMLGQLGFSQSDSADYRVRTRRNVEQADATLIFATDPASDGTRLTVDHARQLGRPWLLVDPFTAAAADEVRAWLAVTQPAVLNVAGNRESRSPGIAQQAERVLYMALRPQSAS
jgi:hypothetical protein